MKGFLVCMLILSALACCAHAAPKVSNICNTCKCLPDASAERARNIQCNCDVTTRAITTTVENMKNLPHLESFTAMNCDSVSFMQESFGSKHDLSNVILKRVNTATFPLGVFAKLDSLKIEDVDDLRLMAKAFLGAEIGEIAIRNTTIREVPELALYNVKLRKLELSGLKIGTIKSNSTLFVMGEQSNLFIDKCTVDRVETKGLELRAQHLRISGSTLTHLAPSSTIIDAALGIDIHSNTFGKSDAEGMRVSSRNINIVNNTFFNIPIVLANTAEGGNVGISNNVFQDVTFNQNVLGFLTADFNNNYFLCDCDFASKLKLAEVFAQLQIHNFDVILSNNFCQSNCNKLSAKGLLEQFKVNATCLPEEWDQCAPNEQDYDAQDGNPNTDVSPRAGRHQDHDGHDGNDGNDGNDGHDEHHEPTVTTVESARTSGHARFGASSLLLAAILAALRNVT